MPTGNNSIQLNWNQTTCFNATGYKIYRRIGFYGYTPSQCETGVPAYTGYTLLTTIQGISNNSFKDDNNGTGLIPGNDYCYMVIAYFDDGAESYASNETCAILIQNLPVMTNVSVVWPINLQEAYTLHELNQKPLTVRKPHSPFEYRLLRAQDLTGTTFTQIATFSDLNDTITLTQD
ncbi:MAG: hypothetical protein R2847_00555 [Bacteroidia bacterium]